MIMVLVVVLVVVVVAVVVVLTSWRRHQNHTIRYLSNLPLHYILSMERKPGT